MLIDAGFKPIYSTGENDPINFFLPALFESHQFDLGLGFFSSSGFRALATGFAYFVANGGTIKILINDFLSEEDKSAVIQGNRLSPEEIDQILVLSFNNLYKNLSEYGQHFFQCISNLIALQKVEFKATIPTQNPGGIAHHKFGIFRDLNGNRIAFTGSINFSISALYYNVENISCFRSWIDETSEIERLNFYENLFNSIWRNESNYLKVIPLEKIQLRIVKEFPPKLNIDLLKDQEAIIAKCKTSIFDLPNKYFKKVQLLKEIPRFPISSGPRNYQELAYNAWCENNYKGIFAMATGTGKTITALNCVLQEYIKEKIYHVVIVVPTKPLANQWIKETQSFNFGNILCTTKDKKWLESLNKILLRSKLKKDENYVIITTYATFNKIKFQNIIKSLPAKHLVFIADEAHNLGTPKSLENLPTFINKRIGLSATPERIYDEIGSLDLFDFFNSSPPDYTYKYSMRKAIEDGILAEYDYYPILVELEPDEAEAYKEMTNRLMRHFDSRKGEFRKSGNDLLIIRKQIIHKARQKKPALKKILDSLSNEMNLNYTFIYVPEGYEPDYSLLDSYSIRTSDRRIINDYSEILNDYGYKTYQFLGGLNDSERILRQFSDGKINILLSMKCLDEGVDIPRTETAVFCASTGNPRQFIQRRGRILRRHEAKNYAKIYDMVVIPPLKDFERLGQKDISRLELNIFKNELKRVVNFVSLSKNPLNTLYGELGTLCEELDINIYELLNEFKKQDK